MICPVDGTSVLVMTERQGIEIDYCPTCRGVWLDRGELDKIIDRAAAEAPPAASPPPGAGSHQPPPQQAQPAPAGYGAMPPADVRSYPAQAWGSKPPRGQYGYEQPRKKKKGGFLGDLFDM
jgi:Zn-finger nucleic acid-binding protein